MAVALAASLLGACVQGDLAETTDEVSEATLAAPMFAGVPQHGPVLGDPAAPVTLVEFSDLRCRHCRDFATQSLPVIVERYVRAGRVRVVFANLPILGQASTQAARMAVAVGLQGHMFEFVAAFFREAPATVTDDVLRRIASEVPGVDAAAALSHCNDKDVTEALSVARKVADHFGVTGTPSFLLGKTEATTAPTLLPQARATLPDTFTAPIDALLAQH